MSKSDWAAAGVALGVLCLGVTVAGEAKAQAADPATATAPAAEAAPTDPAAAPAESAAPTAAPEPAQPVAETEPAAPADAAPVQAEPAATPADEENTAAADAAAEDLAVADALDQGQTELRDKQYLFIGARYRAVFIPTFVQHLFADGGKSLLAHTPGLEFGIRKNQFEYNLFAQYGIYKAEDVPFKGSSDDNTAWEILNFDYSILTLGTDFMWSTDDFAPGLSMTYGAGVGLGAVFGELNRVQAFAPGASDQGNPDSYVRCERQGVPDNQFCGTNNDHYGDYVEPTWADGGSSPLVFPWIAGQLGLRYKVHRNFVGRIEIGIMPTGAFAGVGAAYGL